MSISDVSERAHSRLADVLLVLGPGLKHCAQNDLDSVELDEFELVEVVVARQIGQNACAACAYVYVRVGVKQLDQTLNEAFQVVLANGAVAQIAQREKTVVHDALLVRILLKLPAERLHGAVLHQHALVLWTHAQNLVNIYAYNRFEYVKKGNLNKQNNNNFKKWRVCFYLHETHTGPDELLIISLSHDPDQFLGPAARLNH